MKILAVNFGHDASLAYFAHGTLVAFDEAERLTRRKHQFGVSAQYIQAFLKGCGVDFAEVDVIAICSTQGWKMRHCEALRLTMGSPAASPLLERVGIRMPSAVSEDRDGERRYDDQADAQGLRWETASPRVPRHEWPYLDGPLVTSADLSRQLDKLPASAARSREWLKSFLIPFDFRLDGKSKPALFVDHHACHAFYAHFYSASPKSIVCTHDGGDPSYFPFNSGGLYLSDPTLGVLPVASHNLGLGIIYDQVASAVGLEGEPGKLMGLAAYGMPSPAVFGLADLAIETFAAKDWQRLCALSERILAVSGQEPSLRRSDIQRFRFDLPNLDTAIQAAANTQFLVQGIFATVVGRMATQINQVRPDLTAIDLAGGFTFNCPSNQALQQQFPTVGVNPLPGASDTGLPIGAAAALCYLLGVPIDRCIHQEGLAAAFPPANQVPGATPKTDRLTRIEIEPDQLPQFIAQSLIEGKTLCLYRGRSEIGPRALGHRSIIGHATTSEMRDRINACKGREPWRPLAPLCREEDFSRYFDGDPTLARYMLFTYRVRSAYIPAVTHVDGTARVQCIGSSDRWLHPALTRLDELGHHPVIINTSFNCAGEPLVETVEQATSSFLKMGLDYLLTEFGVFSPAMRRRW